jgi:hypothetical protein
MPEPSRLAVAQASKPLNGPGSMNPKRLKRIITCQGSTQLIAAVAAMECRARRQPGPREYEDYLVINSLHAPRGQMDDFVHFIKGMAEVLGTWERIVYIGQGEIQSLLDRAIYSSGIFDPVYGAVGTKDADEIYLGTNWHAANRILMRAYRPAEKICYGDAIGVYYSAKYFAPDRVPASNTTGSYRTWGGFLRGRLGAAKRKLAALAQMKTYLPVVDFDIGYLLLPEASDERPPMDTVKVDREDFLLPLQKLQRLLDREYVTALRQDTADAPVWVLLPSYFSEAGRMTRESEIAAYREFIQSQHVPEKCVLLIKPHPRDDPAKIVELRSALQEQFDRIVVLAEPNQFFLPFEVLFTGLFLEPRQTRDVKVLAFTSAGLLLEYLFNARCSIGFGPTITGRFFKEEWVRPRTKHEVDLASAVERVRNEGRAADSPCYR